jgi:hypothetical protein
MSFNPFTRIAKLEKQVEMLTMQMASYWAVLNKLSSPAELDKHTAPDANREAKLAKKREYNAKYRKRLRVKTKAREYNRAYYARKKAEREASK